MNAHQMLTLHDVAAEQFAAHQVTVAEVENIRGEVIGGLVFVRGKEQFAAVRAMLDKGEKNQ